MSSDNDDDMDMAEPIVEAHIDSDDDSDSVVHAAIAVHEDDEDDSDDPIVTVAEEVAIVDDSASVRVKPDSTISTTPMKKSSKKSSKSSSSSSKKAKSSNGSIADDRTTASASSTKSKPKRKRRPSSNSVADVPVSSEIPQSDLVPPVQPHKAQAATDARALLRENVPSIPVSIADLTVRSFGHLALQADMANSPFATTSALYPVGFCGDRYEFSPSHGRAVQLRCTILEGKRVKEMQARGGFAVSSDLPDGPIFRISWGRGVDENDQGNLQYPYNPALHSAPLGSNVRSDSIPASQVVKGMRVHVKLNDDTMCSGRIVNVGDVVTSKSRSKVEITIEYDDGFQEIIMYPDPDISLDMPSAENEIDSFGNVEMTVMNGKPVQSVVGSSPIKAWGLVLVKLGLIDEVMLDSALESLNLSREQAFQETKMKMEGKTPKIATKLPEEVEVKDAPKEDSSEREKHLRENLKDMLEEYNEAEREDRMTSIELADLRTAFLGGFVCNPFNEDETNRQQQTSWLSTVIRREKTQMGSTGNRRKVVTAVDLLERNDTFYNQDVEALVEGLPGSEHCSSYVFQVFRSGGSLVANSKSWMHEAQLKSEKESLERKRKVEQLEARQSLEQERIRKKQKVEEEKDEKRRQKLEEEENKKTARIEERLAKLNAHVEDKLFKEALYYRERIVSLLLKSISREFTRRRRSAEVLAAHAIVERARPVALSSITKELPNVCKAYDEDTIRVWNFLSIFGPFFVEKSYINDIPTLESLQKAINCLTADETVYFGTGDAVNLLTELAVALCKPLANNLTRVLFASLIALNPVLVKEYGAAFFSETKTATSTANPNATNTENEDTNESQSSISDLIMPVNSLTWQEIARLSLLSDALGELGYQRHEVAHILRGYRSVGHPQSKEARRLRRAEDHAVILTRQQVSTYEHSAEIIAPKARIHVPCSPRSYPGEYWYHLQVVNTLPDTSLRAMHSNLVKAKELLQSSEENKKSSEFISRIDEVLEQLEEIKNLDQVAKSENKIVKKIWQTFNNFYDEIDDEDANAAFEEHDKSLVVSTASTRTKRSQVGLLKNLQLDKVDFRQLAQEREKYMEDALRLKEEMEREKVKGEEDDDDDDDDDEDDDAKQSNNTAAPTAAGEQIGEEGQTVKDETDAALTKIGKTTPYDDFCADIPGAPELIRRCMAVLRSLAMTNSAEPFLYPVDPQTNPGYYDMVLRPMCLREVGKQLQYAATRVSQSSSPESIQEQVELTVLHFGRNVRLISHNCLSYSNAGPMVISAGSELSRVFERLFLDWVLSPPSLLPPLDKLDDDRCVNPHPSDEESAVLLCDGCEGKYNIKQLNPPLQKVPKGDWFCPRCVEGRWWGHVDPRIELKVNMTTNEESTPLSVKNDDVDRQKEEGVVDSCFFYYPEDGQSKPVLYYKIRGSSADEYWDLYKLDKVLQESGQDVPPIQCIDAVAESPGYGFGVDHGLRLDLIPVLLNPNISDAAAKIAMSSSVFRDSIDTASTLLLIDPYEMNASEWLRLLVLLTMKCSSSDALQNYANKIENEAVEKMSSASTPASRSSRLHEMFKSVHGHEENTDDDLKLFFLGEDVEFEEYIVADVKVESVQEPSNAVTAPAVVVDTPSSVGEVVTSAATEAPKVAVVSSVEVIEEPKVVPTVSTTVSGNNAEPVLRTMFSEEAVALATAVSEKVRRQKVLEESAAVCCAKQQLHPTAASFPEDHVSYAIDRSVQTLNTDLRFMDVMCRGAVCEFCGLTDIALGSPLLRVPNEREWEDYMSAATNGRRSHLIADLPVNYRSVNEPNNYTQPTPRKLCSVRIRLNDDLVSFKEHMHKSVLDCGMTEMLPVAYVGFQEELRFRYYHGFPFVTGSYCAHECCAIAAHNSRKDQALQKHKEKQALLNEKKAGLTCGRTLEIGRDGQGRSYWKFFGSDDSLFVCVPSQEKSKPDKWSCYDGIDKIASVIVALGRDLITKDIVFFFPQVSESLQSRSWVDSLLRRQYPDVLLRRKGNDDDDDNDDDDAAVVDNDIKIKVVGDYDPYEAGEDVLVESPSGQFMWDAHIISLNMANKEDDKTAIISGYRVHYTGWSSRFVEWVGPHRVVEPNENNRLLQEELLDELAASKCGLPAGLNMLSAKEFLYSRDRARGSEPIPDFALLSHKARGKGNNAKIFALMKAAILAVESALPVGSVDTSANGLWNRTIAHHWRCKVQDVAGPVELMKCVIMLEDAITPDWIKEDVGHLRSCLPACWKAVGEATPSSLALRIVLMDRSIKYATVDRKRFAKKKKS